MELHIVHVHLPRDSVVSVLVGVLIGLHSADHVDAVALLEILIDEHAGLAPCGTLDKIALLLAVLTDTAVNGYCKVTDLNTASGGAKFGVLGQATGNNNFVNKSFLLKNW